MNLFEQSHRIVIKFGTNSITKDDGSISLSRIYSFIEIMSAIKNAGKELIIVSSGAVSLGMKKLGFEKRPTVTALKQSCAAVGQSQLISIYEEAFSKFGIITAQVLLTEDDFNNRCKYLNLRSTMNSLIKLGVVPVINENDTVSSQGVEEITDEFRIKTFGDNDKLSALVMSKLDADLLIIMSDIDGLYDDDPRQNPEAKLIPVVETITPAIDSLGFGASTKGRGGMKTKIEAAKIAVNSGGYAIIMNGKNPANLNDFINGKINGSVFLPCKKLTGKKRWIAYANNICGKIIINDGAESALREQNASLLPAGILDTENHFSKGDVVSIFNSTNHEVARGIVNYSSDDIEKFKGNISEEINSSYGLHQKTTVVRRENLVLI